MSISGNASGETKQESPWLTTGAGQVTCSMSKEDVDEQEEKKKKDLGRIRRSKRSRGLEEKEKCHQSGEGNKTLPLTIAKVFPSTQEGLIFNSIKMAFKRFYPMFL